MENLAVEDQAASCNSPGDTTLIICISIALGLFCSWLGIETGISIPIPCALIHITYNMVKM